MLRSLKRPASKADFPEDDGMAQGLLGVIVGRLHAVDFQKDKEPFAVPIRIRNSFSQIFGFFITERIPAEFIPCVFQFRNFVPGLLEGKLSPVALLPQLAAAA